MGKIALSGEATFKPGNPPKSGQVSPGLFGRGNQYAAQQALNAGEEVARQAQRTTNTLGIEVQRTAQVIEEANREKERTADVIASEQMDTVGSSLESQAQETWLPKVGKDAIGAGEETRKAYDAVIERLKSEGTLTLEDGSTVNFATPERRELAILRLQQQKERVSRQMYLHERKEYRDAVVKATESQMSSAVTRISLNPSNMQSVIDEMTGEGGILRSQLLGDKDGPFVSQEAVLAMEDSFKIRAYTQYAQTTVTDLTTNAYEAALNGQDYTASLKAAEDVVKSMDGKADAEELEQLQTKIVRYKDRFKSMREENANKAEREALAASSAALSRDSQRVEMWLHNVSAGGPIEEGLEDPVQAAPVISQMKSKLERHIGQMFKIESTKNPEAAAAKREQREMALARDFAMLEQMQKLDAVKQTFNTTTYISLFDIGGL